MNPEGVTRREFVLTAAGLIGSSIAGPPLIAQTADRRIKLGFLSASHSHAIEKFKRLTEMAEYEVVGVCEDSQQVSEAFSRLGAKLLSRNELMDLAEVVAVESAVRDHAKHAKAALEAGKHVHVEKPPAVTLSELEDLVRLASQKSRLLQVGYMWRLNPGFNTALEAARNGWLGDIYLVRAAMNTQISAERRPEWAEFKGGAMFEQGCHLVDVVVRLLGKPKRVTPHLQRRGGDSLADNCIAVLEYPTAQAIITNAVLQPNAGPHRFFEILGTNGTAKVQPIEPPVLEIDLANAAGPYRAGPQKVALPEYRRYVGEFVDLASAIRQGKPLSVSPETELAIQETLLLASGMAER